MKILLISIKMKKIVVFKYFSLEMEKLLGREHFIFENTADER